jgi:hypothetical protein
MPKSTVGVVRGERKSVFRKPFNLKSYLTIATAAGSEITVDTATAATANIKLRYKAFTQRGFVKEARYHLNEKPLGGK